MKAPVLALPLVLLAACAPTVNTPAAPRVEGAVVGAKAGFYPSAPSLRWTYLPEGDQADRPAFEVKVVGPSVYQGKTVTQIAFLGRAQSFNNYRDYRPDGVYLLARVAPQAVSYSYDPPIREYPSEAELKVGATWSGESKVTVTAANGTQSRAGGINYTYRVLSRDQYTVAGTSYDTFLINLETKYSTGETTNQSIRFAPFIGEVRTQDGLLLVSRSF
jgi:hypothetical protein